MVRWGWLAFPLAVLILSVVFFIATVLRMKPDDVGIWKSTPLAFLFGRFIASEVVGGSGFQVCC